MTRFAAGAGGCLWGVAPYFLCPDKLDRTNVLCYHGARGYHLSVNARRAYATNTETFREDDANRARGAAAVGESRAPISERNGARNLEAGVPSTWHLAANGTDDKRKDGQHDLGGPVNKRKTTAAPGKRNGGENRARRALKFTSILPQNASPVKNQSRQTTTELARLRREYQAAILSERWDDAKRFQRQYHDAERRRRRELLHQARGAGR